MSDMYLELRSRIPVVASRTHIGSARLQEAQDAVGLSNETIARRIPVSEKTWRRWKEAGEVPTASLPAVARALRLELLHIADTETATRSADDVLGLHAAVSLLQDETSAGPGWQRRMESDLEELRAQNAEMLELLRLLTQAASAGS